MSVWCGGCLGVWKIVGLERLCVWKVFYSLVPG